ncbi:MAG: hypothetical protein IT294_05335 [Deltaproteobacteria bacterium]|nr:hypothetical protein [Deltaproteobacteria bacterium]
MTARRARTRSLLAASAGAALFGLAVGCARVRGLVEGEPPVVQGPAVTLRAPAGPDAPDLDLHHEWRAAEVRQRVDPRHHDWPYRPFSELVVVNGIAHRALLLLPSLSGKTSRASFRIDVPAGSDLEFVMSVALVAKFAPESDGVDVAWAVGAADDPTTLPLAFEHLAGGRPADDWREVRVDLAPWRGTTVWIVLASRAGENRRHDWVLFGDPRVRAKPSGAPLVVDLRAADALPRRPRAVPWRAATVFKTYSLFGADGPHYGPPQWLRASFPWLESLRILSALGGNHGSTLGGEDAARARAGEAPASFEVGVAERYEIVHDGAGAADGPPAFDWTAFDALNASAASAGLDLHLNLAAAPERFTGGTGSYPTYRFNELPVVDRDGWQRYVGALFGHLAAEPWYPRASFSFFSEANCVWVEPDGTVRKVGFQGDAETYARQYLWTWQAMAPVIGAAPVSLGPWVVESERVAAAADNLGEYLRAIARAFDAAGAALPPWRDFSFNLYETPQLTLDHFASDKIAAARRVPRAVLGKELPLRIEELGIHPLVTRAFEDATGTPLGATRWEMTWHAETAALLLEQGITEAASWYPVLMLYPPNQSLRAYAAYLFASVVAGAVDWSAGDGVLAVAPRPADAIRPATLGVRLGSRHADRVGVLAALPPEAGGGPRRLALWSYPRFAALDARLERGAAPAQVEIALPPRPDGTWKVRILAYDDARPFDPAADVAVRPLRLAAFAGLPPFALREREARDRLALTVAPGDLYLVEIE